MPATLQQIQARLEQALALREDAGEMVQTLALGGAGVPAEERTRHVAKLQGYQREVELLHKIERDLLSQGRAAENDLRILSGFDAPEAMPAAVTPSQSSDAQMAPREAPRSEASAPPLLLSASFAGQALPAAGDVF